MSLKSFKEHLNESSLVNENIDEEVPQDVLNLFKNVRYIKQARETVYTNRESVIISYQGGVAYYEIEKMGKEGSNGYRLIEIMDSNIKGCIDFVFVRF